MDTDTVHKILIETLQQALTGNLKDSSDVSPQRISEAIMSKIDFGRTHAETSKNKMVDSLAKSIGTCRAETEGELSKLTKEDEKLLRN